MHAETIPVSEAQLRHSLAEHAPEYRDLSMTPLAHSGTETRLFRLGQRLLLRIPLLESSANGFAAETRWTDWLAPHLPLAVPTVVAQGRVATTPPLPWTIRPWIDGKDATQARPEDQHALADQLASCLKALRQAPAPDIPPQSPRGGPLAPQDDAFRNALADARSRGLTGLGPAVKTWDEGLSAPIWQGTPVWLHGDLVPGNLIVSRRRLTAVIDWSFVTMGDPAYDLIPAWFVFDRPTRRRFLDQLTDDAATIARARARVAWQCVLALPYYLDTNPQMVRLARRGLAALEEGPI